MGRAFDVVYDDFTGGHFVGPSQANQPRNTWTGPNVICTADEGFLMSDGGWTESPSVTTSTSATSVPIASARYTGDGAVVFTVGASLFTIPEDFSTVTTVTTTIPNPTTTSNSHITTDINGWVLASSNLTVNRISLAGTSTPSGTTQSVPAEGVWRWKNWFLHLSETARATVYFSAPDNPASWPAANTLVFGSTDAVAIEAIVTTADSLYVGTREGWWQVTGVLGETTVIRRITKFGIDIRYGGAVYAKATLAAESTTGIFNVSTDAPSIQSLRGSTTTVALHSTAGRVIAGIVSAATHVLATSSPTSGAVADSVWVWSETAHRWRLSTLPFTGFAFLTPAEAARTAGRFCYAVGRRSGTIYAYRALIEPVEPVQTGTTFDSATVRLAEYQANRPFRVKEVLAEVDFGNPTDNLGVGVGEVGARALTVQIVTNAVSDMDADFARTTAGAVAPKMSTAQTKRWTNAFATKNGDREMVRMAPNDGSPSYTAAPKITMQGVKVRRVIMRCEEQ